MSSLLLLVALTGFGHAQSPRNGLIAFADREAGDPSPALHGVEIYTIHSDGTKRKRLTDSAGANFLPAWSPDGKRIAFMSTRTGVPEIWVMNADGGKQRQITLGGGTSIPSWHPSGEQIACVSHGQIWLIDADGGNPRQLTGVGRNHVPSFSPDGERISFWRGDQRGYGQIWTMKADGTDQKQLTQPRVDAYTPRGSSANASCWLFSDRITYWSGIEHRYGQVWVMDADGGNATQLTDSAAPISNDNPVWSPDGEQILFDTSRDGRPAIYAMDADGGNQRPVVPNLRFLPGRPTWQPVFGN